MPSWPQAQWIRSPLLSNWTGRVRKQAGLVNKLNSAIYILLRLSALSRHYDWNFQILSKNFRLFFFLSKQNMIQYAKKGYFLIEKKKEFRFNSDCVFSWSLILLSLKVKVPHDFWTKFGNANHSCTRNRRDWEELADRRPALRNRTSYLLIRTKRVTFF